MDTHKNAPLTPKGREMMVRAVVDCGLSKAAAARQFNLTPKTVAKWVKRFRAEGAGGLHDRSSRPLSSPSQTTPDAANMSPPSRPPGSHTASDILFAC
jgi:transposase-like protein